jgi:hypothetical protein
MNSEFIEEEKTKLHQVPDPNPTMGNNDGALLGTYSKTCIQRIGSQSNKLVNFVLFAESLAQNGPICKDMHNFANVKHLIYIILNISQINISFYQNLLYFLEARASLESGPSVTESVTHSLTRHTLAGF